jgi:hypothetical protein
VDAPRGRNLKMRAFHGVALATVLVVTTSGCLGGRAERGAATQKRADQK